MGMDALLETPAVHLIIRRTSRDGFQQAPVTILSCEIADTIVWCHTGLVRLYA